MPVLQDAIRYSSVNSEQGYTKYTTTETQVVLCLCYLKQCGIPCIYSEQEYTGFTETENRVLFTSLVKQEYTATENLVELVTSCEA